MLSLPCCFSRFMRPFELLFPSFLTPKNSNSCKSIQYELAHAEMNCF
jgi:hypothetical protein